MTRKILLNVEHAILCALQLFVLGYSLIGLSTAGADSAYAPVTAQAAGAKRWAFLDQYPVPTDQKLAQAQGIWQLGENSFANYRVFKHKTPQKIVQQARENFLSECAGVDGHVDQRIVPSDVARHYSVASRISLGTEQPVICVDDALNPLGILFASSQAGRRIEPYAALFVLTPRAATEMLIIYHRGMAKELRQQADMAAKNAADEMRWAEWRAALAIGSETHCGPVLELRGPVVQVAHGTQADWVRRERLFPPSDRYRCWEFSGH